MREKWSQNDEKGPKMMEKVHLPDGSRQPIPEGRRDHAVQEQLDPALLCVRERGAIECE